MWWARRNHGWQDSSSNTREVDFLGEVLEIRILVTEASEELLDVFLLFGHEFLLSQFISVVLSLAAEVASHLGAEQGSVLHLHLGKELVESPGHFHDTQWGEELAFSVFQGIGEDGMTSLGVVVLVERGEIVDTVVFHRTKFGEAVGDDAWHLARLKSFSQQFFFVQVLLGIKLIIDYLNNVENGKMLPRK